VSDQTKEAMDAAIAAHIADEADGALITGYVLHAAYFNTDTDTRGSTGYYHDCAEGQGYHIGLGLAHMLVDHYSDSVYDITLRDDEDD
jgi:hypothetical protein